jgi:NADH-quinone oxidoreductase subunit A
MENHPYLFLAVLACTAVVFCITPLVLARIWAILVAPPRPGEIKNATYECGLETKGDAWGKFHSGYYIYAIIFLVFDVEAVFLLPFAVAFGKLSVGAFVAMMVFLLLLVEGLVWAWRRGFLQWR